MLTLCSCHLLVFSEGLPEDLEIIPVEMSMALRKHRHFIIDGITDLSPLLNMLFVTGVLTHRQCECIKHGDAVTDKVKLLLDIIQRRSLKHYKLFLGALKETGQARIAESLEGNARGKVDDQFVDRIFWFICINKVLLIRLLVWYFFFCMCMVTMAQQ